MPTVISILKGIYIFNTQKGPFFTLPAAGVDMLKYAI